MTEAIPPPLDTDDSHTSGVRRRHKEERFQRIFEAEFGYVHNTLSRLGVRGADLDDFAQEVFVTVFRRLDDIDPLRPIRPWLFGVAFRIVSERRRRTRPGIHTATSEIDPVDNSGSALDAMEEREQRSLVIDALQSVDMDRRAVLVMHEIDEIPIPLVAETLMVPVNTAYSRLRVAREEFKAAVARLSRRAR